MYIDPRKLSKKGLRKYQEISLKEGPVEYEALDSWGGEYFVSPQFHWEYRKALRKHRVLKRILEGVGHESHFSEGDWEGVSEEMLKVCENMAQIVLDLEDKLEEVRSELDGLDSSHLP